MQFTLKEIRDTENGKEIIGINYDGKEIRYPYSGVDDVEEINNKLKNCMIVFNEEKGIVTAGWSDRGTPLYSPKDKSIGNDSSRAK